MTSYQIPYYYEIMLNKTSKFFSGLEVQVANKFHLDFYNTMLILSLLTDLKIFFMH